MSAGPTSETQFFERVNQILQVHENLLCDSRRNRLFYRALKKSLRPGAAVLDIGAGTGLWAIAAAKLGAKRVVAIEQNPHLVGVIRTLCQEHQVAGIVETIAGDSRAVNLGRDFDLVISETIGYIAFEEQIVSIMADARARFLKPGGTQIPATVALVAAPAQVAKQPTLPAGLPFEFRFFETLAAQRPLQLERGAKLRLLAAPQVLCEADLTADSPAPLPTELTARWPLADSQALAGIAVWVESTLAPGIRLDTRRTTSWTPILYRLRPLATPAGELEFRLSPTSATNSWTATLRHGDQVETQTLSPAYALAEMEARLHGNASVFDHLQRVGLMPK